MNDNLDIYLYIIIALLPLTSLLVVLQVNPYHALALRGILGAVAALVYAVLGAADVALTEALMGTLLAITLYAVAVRSSMVLHLGVLADATNHLQDEDSAKELMVQFRRILKKRHMRLEVVPYNDITALGRALMEKEIHGTITSLSTLEYGNRQLDSEQPQYQLTIRIQRIYEILQAELSDPKAVMYYRNVLDIGLPKLEEKRL